MTYRRLPSKPQQYHNRPTPMTGTILLVPATVSAADGPADTAKAWHRYRPCRPVARALPPTRNSKPRFGGVFFDSRSDDAPAGRLAGERPATQNRIRAQNPMSSGQATREMSHSDAFSPGEKARGAKPRFTRLES